MKNVLFYDNSPELCNKYNNYRTIIINSTVAFRVFLDMAPNRRLNEILEDDEDEEEVAAIKLALKFGGTTPTDEIVFTLIIFPEIQSTSKAILHKAAEFASDIVHKYIVEYPYSTGSSKTNVLESLRWYLKDKMEKK